jgi:hypothetical protein
MSVTILDTYSTEVEWAMCCREFYSPESALWMAREFLVELTDGTLCETDKRQLRGQNAADE